MLEADSNLSELRQFGQLQADTPSYLGLSATRISRNQSSLYSVGHLRYPKSMAMWP
jgi:hypothetical protein